jgi:acyl-CoA thioesterase FadM
LQYFIAAGDPESGPFAFAHVTAELQLRYVAACFYDEPLRVRSKLVRLGRSSAEMEQALVGAGETLRALSRVAIVRSDGDSTSPWSEAQRAVLEGFEQRSF